MLSMCIAVCENFLSSEPRRFIVNSLQIRRGWCTQNNLSKYIIENNLVYRCPAANIQISNICMRNEQNPCAAFDSQTICKINKRTLTRVGTWSRAV